MEPSRHADTVTPHPPNIPRGADSLSALSESDIKVIVDNRIIEHLRQIDEARRLSLQEVRAANIKARSLMLGLGGVVGFSVGIGSTMLAQRIRRRNAAMK